MRSSVWQVLKANVESVLLLANLEASTHVLICQAQYLKSFMKICKDWQRSQQLLGLHNIWLAAVPGKLEEWQTFHQVTWMWMGADPTSACPEARRRRRTEQGAMVLERTTSRTSHGYLDLGKHTDCGSFTLGFSLGVNIPHQFSCHGFQMFSLTYTVQLLCRSSAAFKLDDSGRVLGVAGSSMNRLSRPVDGLHQFDEVRESSSSARNSSDNADSETFEGHRMSACTGFQPFLASELKDNFTPHSRTLKIFEAHSKNAQI